MSHVSKKIVVTVDEFEIRVAILENRQLVEFYLEETGQRRIVGNIYLGKVKNILPGMEAAFVNIGLERTAFLYVNEAAIDDEEIESAPKIQQILQPGQELLVQVTKSPSGSKGARVTTQLGLPGRKLVLLPFGRGVGASKRLNEEERERLRSLAEKICPPDMGLIVRTVAERANLDDLSADLDYLLRLWKTISYRTKHSSPTALIYNELDLASRVTRDIFSSDFDELIIDDEYKYKDIINLVQKTSPDLISRVHLYKNALPLFDKYDIDNQLTSALGRIVWLRSGGCIAIDQTEALTAIDVNTAKYTGGRNLEETIFRTNMEAAKEIVRQLRLRDIGGIIVIDFIDMQNPEHKQTVFETFSQALEADRTKSRVIDISRLGLVEMTRKNLSAGLINHYYDQCSACRGLGKVMSVKRATLNTARQIEKLIKIQPGEAFVFLVSPKVAEAMHKDNEEILNHLKTRTGREIFLLSNSSYKLEESKLVKKGSIAEIKSFLSAS